MCKCQVFTTEDGRHRIREIANKQPLAYAITPFGLDERIQDPKKQIVKNPKYSNKYSVTRVNNNVHAKMLVTRDYVIVGSCNFTTNSIENEHEILQIIERECHPTKHRKYKEFFETLWDRSTEIERGEAVSA